MEKNDIQADIEEITNHNTDSFINSLYSLRHTLHMNAELSHREKKTSGILKDFVKSYNPDEIIDFDFGFAIIWDSGKPGKTLMFRADIDALPISEQLGIEYISLNSGVMHACGHDGHSTIMAGLAVKISNNPPDTGKAVLLFQPAEETGEGAERVVTNSKFSRIEPDYVFGLHNIPGYPLHSILVKDNSFACASRGMTIKLIGKTSHAAEPENGVNPVFAIKELIDKFYALIAEKDTFSAFTNLTIIHIRLGEIAFGTSPGYAEVMATLRSETNDDMDLLVSNCENILQKVAKKEKLQFDISYSEIFPATINDKEASDMIRDASSELNLYITELKNAFRWSEDFSQYTSRFKGAFFGLGAGSDHPMLHNPDYDFPDEIIETGINTFYKIYTKLMKKNKRIL